MDIGGYDVILPVRPGLPLLPIILHRIRELWPEAVVEDAETSETHPLVDGSSWSKSATLREVFVYRDDVAREAWDENGGIPENQGSMIHVLLGSTRHAKSTVTIVVGDRSPAITSMLDDLRLSLSVPSPRHPHRPVVSAA